MIKIFDKFKKKSDEKEKIDPKILVKKEDGSSVYMSLAQLQEYRGEKEMRDKEKKSGGISEQKQEKDEQRVADQSNATRQYVLRKDKKPEMTMPALVEKKEISKSTPVKDVFVDEAKAKMEEVRKREVSKGVDEEKMKEQVEKEKAILDGKKEKEEKVVDTVTGTIKDKVKKKLLVWDKEDHKSLSDEPPPPEVSAGGEHIPPKDKDETKLVIGKLSFQIADETKPGLDLLIQSRFNDVRNDQQILDQAVRPKAMGGLGLTPVQAKELLDAILSVPKAMTVRKKESAPMPSTQSAGAGIVKKISPKGAPQEKPMIQDVVVDTAVKMTVGPVDEMRNFKLVDLQRLSRTLEKSKEIILGKFEALNKESFVLYMDAVLAWYTSPLYKKYQAVIKNALLTADTIEKVLSSDKTDMKKEEFDIVRDINKSLVI